MNVDNEYHNQPIERSVIVLGILLGATFCVSIALLTMHYFNNVSNFFLYDLAVWM